MKREQKIELLEHFAAWLVAAMVAIPFVVGLMSILLFLLGGAHG
ncbi:MAG: hypothetical protein ACLGIW_08115 [Gammaproteobacteria bacterium]